MTYCQQIDFSVFVGNAPTGIFAGIDLQVRSRPLGKLSQPLAVYYSFLVSIIFDHGHSLLILSSCFAIKWKNLHLHLSLVSLSPHGPIRNNPRS